MAWAGNTGEISQRTAQTSQPDTAETDEDRDVSSYAFDEARKETRKAWYFALVALLVAVLSSGGTAVSLFGLRKSVSYDSSEHSTVLDETVYPTFPGIEDLRPGWARCLVNAVVRAGHDPESKKVAVIRMNAQVLVEEVRGRRIRISEPIHGWVSSMSNDGIEIIRANKPKVELEDLPLNSKHHLNHPSVNNMTLEESMAKLKEQVLKFKDVRFNLLGALENATKKIADKAEVHNLADRASEKAGSLVEKLQRFVKDVDLSRFDPDRAAKDLANGQVYLPGGVHLDLTKKAEDKSHSPGVSQQELPNIVE